VNSEHIFYLCPVCFETSESGVEYHRHQMIRCDAGQPGDERRKPLVDDSGQLKSRAPRWFLEAVGWVPASR